MTTYADPLPDAFHMRTHGELSVFGEDENNACNLLPPADGHTEGSGWPYVIAGPDRGLGYGRTHVAHGVQSEIDAYILAAAPAMLAALYRALFVLESPALPSWVNGAGTVDAVRAAIELAKRPSERNG